MYFNSLRPTWHKAMVDKFLAAMQTVPTGVLLGTGKAHLLMATLSFDWNTPLASFTALEANYTGYLPVALASLVGPVNLIAGTDGLIAECNFIAPNPLTAANNIFGYWVDAGTPVDWVLAELFPQPLPLSVPGDFIDLTIAFPLSGLNVAQ